MKYKIEALHIFAITSVHRKPFNWQNFELRKMTMIISSYFLFQQ